MQRLLSVFCALLGTAHAQSAHFVVASIKPAPPPAQPSESAFQHDPGRVAFAKVNLSTLIVNATGLPRNAVSGPDWIDWAWFQFSATTPPDATNQQLQEMFLNFMEERFAFKYHRESHEKRGYALTVAPRGPRQSIAFGCSARAGRTAGASFAGEYGNGGHDCRRPCGANTYKVPPSSESAGENAHATCRFNSYRACGVGLWPAQVFFSTLLRDWGGRWRGRVRDIRRLWSQP
jgi:hypothetical protein